MNSFLSDYVLTYVMMNFVFRQVVKLAGVAALFLFSSCVYLETVESYSDTPSYGSRYGSGSSRYSSNTDSYNYDRVNYRNSGNYGYGSRGYSSRVVSYNQCDNRNYSYDDRCDDNYDDGKVRLIDASSRHNGRRIPRGWHDMEWFECRGFDTRWDRFEDRSGNRFGRTQGSRRRCY